MSVPEPIRDHPYCDICSRTDGILVEVISPPYPDDRRRERIRVHHRSCVADLRKAEGARARIEMERLFADRKARREAAAMTDEDRAIEIDNVCDEIRRLTQAGEFLDAKTLVHRLGFLIDEAEDRRKAASLEP